MISVDAEYEQVVASLPVELRAAAGELPRALQLGGDGRFSDYVRLPPFQALPRFAVEDAGEPALLAGFERAHCRAGFHALLLDRLADGQAPLTDSLRALVAPLRRAWLDALTEACGDPAAAERAIAVSLHAWRAGVEWERAAVAAATLTLPAWGSIVRCKNAWFSVSSAVLLARLRRAQQWPAFQCAADLLLIAAQCLDDAVDAVEDARLHGASWPARLGYPAAGFIRAAPKLLRRGAEAAAAGGFQRLSDWLSGHAAAVSAWPIDESPLRAEWAAQIIAGAVWPS